MIPILVCESVGTSVSTLFPASSFHTAFRPLATASASRKPAPVVSPKATWYCPTYVALYCPGTGERMPTETPSGGLQSKITNSSPPVRSAGSSKVTFTVNGCPIP